MANYGKDKDKEKTKTKTKTKTEQVEEYGLVIHLECNTGSRSSPSAVVWSFSRSLDLETPVISFNGDVLSAGRVCPALKELPLVAAKLEQIAEDHVDLQREVTCLDVTEKSLIIFMIFCFMQLFKP